MRKFITLGLLLASTIFVHAQKTDSSITKGGINGNNELKINLAYTIAGIPEINYERIIKDDMSVGIAVLFGIDENNDYNFGVIPNYRIYFGSKKANGFFIEGNTAVISSRNTRMYINYNPTTNTYNSFGNRAETNFGLGAAAGAKFLTKNGFVGEIYLGAGRLFGDNSIGAYPRAGITIGKRF